MNSVRRRPRGTYARGDVHVLPPDPGRARRAPLHADRAGRPAADLDGRPGHRAAGLGGAPARTAWPVPSRRRTWSPTPASRSSRAGCSTGSARRGCSPPPASASASAMALLVVVGRRRTGRSRRRTSARPWPAALLPQVGSCVRARWSHVLDAARPTCRRRSRWRRCSTRPSSSSARSWSRVLATAWHPVAGIAVAVVACVGGTLAFAAQRATEPPAAPARPVRRAAAADAVAHGRPARRRLRPPSACSSAPPRSPRSRSPTSRATRRWAGGAARAVGARQPDRRASSPARSTGGAARRSGSAGARSRWPARWCRCTSSARCR